MSLRMGMESGAFEVEMLFTGYPSTPRSAVPPRHGNALSEPATPTRYLKKPEGSLRNASNDGLRL